MIPKKARHVVWKWGGWERLARTDRISTKVPWTNVRKKLLTIWRVMVYKIFIPSTYSKESTFSLHDFPFLPKPILVLNVYNHWTFRYLWLLLYIFIRILVLWRNWGAQGIKLTASTLNAFSLSTEIVWVHALKDFVFNCIYHPSVPNGHCSPQKIS